MQARYVILRVLMDCDSPVVSIERITGSDGKPDLLIRFDRSKLEAIGKPAIGEFLKKLQVNNDCMSVYQGSFNILQTQCNFLAT